MVPPGGSIQRFHCLSHVEVQQRIELLREPSLEIVAHPLRLWSVDDVDGSLQTNVIQRAPVIARPLNPSIHPVGIGPISLDGHCIESVFIDEPASYAGAFPIEFVSPVAGFTQENHPGGSGKVEERIVVLAGARNRIARRCSSSASVVFSVWCTGYLRGTW